jgi:hypothetical protein
VKIKKEALSNRHLVSQLEEDVDLSGRFAVLQADGDLVLGPILRITISAENLVQNFLLEL